MCAKLVGFSFGVNEKVSPVTKKRGFEKEERSRSIFACSSSSKSRIPVKDSEMNDSNGKGNGVGFSAFHGSSSAGEVAEGVNLSGKEGSALRNFDLNESGMLATEINDEDIIGDHYNIHVQKKKKTSKKPKLAAVGDPDWLPEQGNCIRSTGTKERVKSDSKGSRLVHCQNSKSPSEEHEGMTDSKPSIERTTMPDSLKDLLSSSGWIVVFMEGSCHAIHVSPSGSVYGSLPKALEDYFRDTSIFRKKQSGSSQSVSSSTRGVAKRPYNRKGIQKKRATTATEPMASSQQKSDKENDKESSVLPVGTESKEVHEGVTFCREENRENSCIQDKCLSSEGKQLHFGNGVVGVGSDKADSELHRHNKFIEVKRPVGINRKHVPRNSKSNREMREGKKHSPKCVMPTRDKVPQNPENDNKKVELQGSPVDMFKLDACLNRQEAVQGENDNKESSVPQKMRYREVHELLASSTVEEKANICNSTDGLMHGMLPQKQEPDERNDKESAPIPEQLRDVRKVLPSYIPDGKETSSIKDDCLSNETERLDWSSAVVKNEQNKDNNFQQIDELVGVRRSTRINGRHVPVESEMVGMWANDDFLELSSSIVSSVADKNKDTIMEIKVEKFEEGPSTVDNMLFKRPSTKKCDYQKSRNKKLLKKLLESTWSDDTLEGCDEIKSPVSLKCSSSSTKNGAKSQITKKQSAYASKKKSFGGGYSNGKKNKKRSGGCGLIVRRTGKGDHEETMSYETKVSMLSWLIDSGTLAENEKVIYKTKKGRRRILKGWVTRGGIRCNCCKKVLSLSEFEVHAGSNIRQPWKITCLTSGKSLLQCQSEAWEKEKRHRKIGFQTVGIGDADPSDDTCGICADGGPLICCDGCPSTFHQECVKLKSVPEGNWFCPFCRCAFCLLIDHGQDESDGTMNLLSCNQCGYKYHRNCILEKDSDKRGLNSSYCGKNCKKVAAGLTDMVGVSNPLGGGFSWSLIRRLDEEGISSDQMQSSIMECNAKLSLALLVLHECFVPLLDPRSGLDMIVQAVYNCGSNFNRLNYEGFYTAILEKDDAIISVATLRFHGTRLVEMPFIGTRPIYRRQGMCRRLLNAVEEMLSALHVEKLIIPAIPDMLETWMKSFSFTHLELTHKEEIRNMNMIIFAETTLLQKPLCCERENHAKEARQLDLVDGLGQGINISHHLLNCNGGHIQVILNCCSSEDRRQGYEVANPGPYEVIKAPLSADAASVSHHSEVFNGSIQNVDMLSQNLERRLDIILTETSISPKKVSLPDTHVLMSAKC